MLCQFTEQVFQIFIDPKIIGLGRFDKAVKDGACPCTVDRVDIDPILSSQGKWPDGLLCAVVVHGHISILQEHTQELLLIDAVPEAVADIALCRQFLYLGLCPRKESINLRF